MRFSRCRNRRGEAVVAIRAGQDFDRVDRPRAGRLLDLDRRERAVGGHDVGLRRQHAVEGLLPPLHREVEVLGFHGPGTVVGGARLDGRDLGSGNEPHQIAGPESDLLRLQMARYVIGNFSRRRAKAAVERRFVAQRPQKFVRIDDCRGELLDVVACEEIEVRAPHRHRTGRIKCRDPVAFAYVGAASRRYSSGPAFARTRCRRRRSPASRSSSAWCK